MLKIINIALFATSFTLTANAYETITLEQLEAYKSDSSYTVDKQQTETGTGKEVVLGAGSCSVATDTISGLTTATFSFLKCQTQTTFQIVRVDPPGWSIGNREWFKIEGTEEITGVAKVAGTRNTGTSFNTGTDEDAFSDIIGNLNMQSACNQISRNLNNIRYTDDEKNIIAECFDL